MKRTLMIEGFPYCFGDGDKPSWYEGEKLDCLAPMGKRGMIRQSIDPMGGVARINNLAFSLADKTGEQFTPQNPLASIFRFWGDESLNVSGPDPIMSNTLTIEAERTTHGFRKKLSMPVSGDRRLILDGADWDFSDSFTFEFWYDHVLPTTAAQTIYRKVAQHGLYAYNSGAYVQALYFAASPGGVSSNYLHNNNTMNEGWRHIGVTYDHTALELTLYSDGVPKTWNAIANFNALTGTDFGLYGRNDSPVYPPLGDFGRIRIWKRALSATEWANAYAGKPVDMTDVFFNSEWMEPWGALSWDKSGDSRHIRQAPGSTWETRDYLKGDLLYFPRDTARVQEIDSVAGEITVDRGVFSCLENTYKPYYATAPFNTNIFRAHEDYPQSYSGRLIAYYEGGHDIEHLKYIGYISSVSQRGKSWNIETVHVLKPFKDGFKPTQIDLPLKTEGDAGYYWAGSIRLKVMAGSTPYTVDLNVNEGMPLDELEGEINSLIPSEFAFSRGTGWYYNGSDLPTVVSTPGGEASDKLFTPSGEWISGETGTGHRSAMRGIPLYGFIYAAWQTANVGMEIELDYDYPWGLDNAWLHLEIDGSDWYFKVHNIDSAGVITIIGPYDSDLIYQHYLTLGHGQEHPIVLRAAAIVNAINLPRMIYSILVSTGTNANGDHDTLPGYLGLGLPKEIIDTSILQLDSNWEVMCNLEDAKIGDDLKIMGLGLIVDGSTGKIKLKRFTPPILAQAKETITDQDITDIFQVNWGHVAPCSNISIECKNGTINSTLQVEAIHLGSVTNSKKLTSSTGAYVENLEPTQERIFRTLQWLGNYAPSVPLTIPKNTLYVGDVIALTLRWAAGSGDYGIEDIPGIVISKTVGVSQDQITVVLNTNPTAQNVAWVPSWEIEDYAGTTITLSKDEALYLETHFALPLEVQIIDSMGTVLHAAYEIDSVTDPNTIVLDLAPTYNKSLYKGIITLRDWTSASTTHKSAFAWAADTTTGLFSDSADGKELL